MQHGRFAALISFFFLYAAMMNAESPSAALDPRASGPGIIKIGSPLVWGGTNDPDTYSDNSTFSSTQVKVDNGKVIIWQKQVPTGSNGEWDIFYMKTTNGGPLAGDINAYWAVVMNYTLTAPVFFDQVVTQWQVNGTPVNPLGHNILGICCGVTSNPILPGPAFYNSGFSGALPAGTQTNWQQVFTSSYNLVSEAGINPSTANEFVFALHFTLQGAKPEVTAAISASQFGAFPTFGPGSWIEIYGSNLSEITEQWADSSFNGLSAPTSTGGTSVTIGGKSAFVEYVSPGQVNVQVPGGVPTGSQPLVLTTEAGSSDPLNVTIVAEKPGLLAASAFKVGGTQYVEALFPDGKTFALAPGAISGILSRLPKPGDTLTLYGIGFGQVNEGIPPGQIAQGQTELAAPFTISIGGSSATITYAGLAPGFVGLYQFDVVVPSIGATNSAPVTFSLGGQEGAQTLAMPIGN
ncbi:MAG TPA: IPT/TIG domain-containing protein [Bryobacteraceae bacterium]|nr:IPT/TIG domain-containing protein [Bryobacteraceae bacterium]